MSGHQARGKQHSKIPKITTFTLTHKFYNSIYTTQHNNQHIRSFYTLLHLLIVFSHHSFLPFPPTFALSVLTPTQIQVFLFNQWTKPKVKIFHFNFKSKFLFPQCLMLLIQNHNRNMTMTVIRSVIEQRL